MDEMDDGRFAGLKGKRFDFNAPERRCLELQLEPAERMRQEAARIELRALLEARAFLVERLGLPESCKVRIVRENSRPVAIEIVEPQPSQPSTVSHGAEDGQK